MPCLPLYKLTQSEEERERYEARRKFQLDYKTGMRLAREEGRREGRIAITQLCERILNRPGTPAEQLASCR
jgi:flagellar biosynthesis/type III secretory pathway protein FliH